jgi:micrococcal nuclease
VAGRWREGGTLIGEYLQLTSSPHPFIPRLRLATLLSLLQFSLLCCCLLLLVGCQATPKPTGRTVTVQVQRVASGHSLDVLNPNQPRSVLERVRLIGIEAPDIKQEPWGTSAKNRFEQMIGTTTEQQLILQPVILEADVPKKDRFGRYLAYVWYKGLLINEELVKEGYVLAAPPSPDNKYSERMARAQEYARIMGYGIWNPEQPMRMTPAEFRRLNP